MSVEAFLSPRLVQLAEKFRVALVRAGGEGDEEAVHDLRVVLRRLRSLLKPARKVYGAFHTDAVRAALKAVADATGELRDEEVLLETIGDLPLAKDLHKGRSAWLKHRREREAALRAELLRMLHDGQGARAHLLLVSLVSLPVDPDHDRPAGPFAARIVRRAARDVERGSDVNPADIEKLHTLRILYKRLRYAAEGFCEILPPEQAALVKVAERFQKRLGTVHDLDVAAAIVGADAAAEPELRAALLAALQGARVRAVQRFLDEKAATTEPPATV